MAVVTNADTGKGELLDIKKLQEPIDGVVASCCLPIISGGKFVDIRGKRYVEGSITNPIPLRYAIETFGCNNTLLVMNAPLKRKGMLEKLTFRFPGGPGWLFNFNKQLRSSLGNYTENYNRDVEYATKLLTGKVKIKGVNIVAISPSVQHLSWHSLNEGALKTVTQEAKNFILEIFDVRYP